MRSSFQPDFVSPPGETLKDALDELGLSMAEFAARISMPEADIRAVVDGRTPIGHDMASRFETALNVPRDFWIALESNYQQRKLMLDERQRAKLRNRTIFFSAAVGAMTVALVACPLFAVALHRANAQVDRAEARISAARIEGADEGYAAAEVPAQAAPTNAIGYVYLGMCEKVWSNQKFGRLPPCDVDIPADGKRIISWKGDVIRETLPVTVNGHRKFGAPIGRVSAGYTVILRSLHAVSSYPNGPQHYWGKVELPEQPAEQH